jgi:hypothetical protein
MLTIMIPGPAGEDVFLDIEVTYDVIATSGPPEPALDTLLTGWSFVARWRADPKSDNRGDYLEVPPEEKDLSEMYVRYVDKYVGDNFRVIQSQCRDFELTKPDYVV